MRCMHGPAAGIPHQLAAQAADELLAALQLLRTEQRLPRVLRRLLTEVLPPAAGARDGIHSHPAQVAHGQQLNGLADAAACMHG